jgi:hypothetical protein
MTAATPVSLPCTRPYSYRAGTIAPFTRHGDELSKRWMVISWATMDNSNVYRHSLNIYGHLVIAYV